MNYLETTIWIDEPEFEEVFGTTEDAKRTFEVEFDYEPADTSVGINHETFALIKATDTKTQEEYWEGDVPQLLWDRLEESMREEAIESREEAKAEAAIAHYEARQNYSY